MHIAKLITDYIQVNPNIPPSGTMLTGCSSSHLKVQFICGFFSPELYFIQQKQNSNNNTHKQKTEFILT